MTSPQGLHLKTIVLIVIMISVAPLGDVFLGKGMKRIPAMASWAPGELFRFFLPRIHIGHRMDRDRVAACVLRRIPFGAFLGGL